MKTLTLSVDERVNAEARRVAAQQGTSVSAMFSRIVRLLSAESQARADLGPLTNQATGLIRLQQSASEKCVLADALVEKSEMAR